MHELDVVLGSEICVWGSAGRSPEAKACTNCHARYLKYGTTAAGQSSCALHKLKQLLLASCTKYSSLLLHP